MPVLSWLVHRGRCRLCGVGVSWRYPAIEALTAGVFVMAFLHEQRVAVLAVLLLAAVMMITLAIIDLEHRRLPFSLLVILAVSLMIWRWQVGAPDLMASVFLAATVAVGGVTLAAVSRKLLGAPLMGAGDAYGLAIGALALPWLSFGVFVGLAGVLGLMFGVGWRLRTGQNAFPFAPALFTGLWLALLYDQNLIGFVS